MKNEGFDFSLDPKKRQSGDQSNELRFSIRGIEYARSEPAKVRVYVRVQVHFRKKFYQRRFPSPTLVSGLVAGNISRRPYCAVFAAGGQATDHPTRRTEKKNEEKNKSASKKEKN